MTIFDEFGLLSLDEPSLDEPLTGFDRDGVRAMHDLEASAGDEEGLLDLFMVDQQAASEVGAQLDNGGDEEPLLD